MNTAHYLTALARTADALGVTLPGPVADALAVEHGLPALADVEAEVVAEIASAFGTKTYEKTRDAALDRLTRAESGSRIRRHIEAALSSARWSSAVLHAEEIRSAFADALADDFDALNASAGLVPATASSITGTRPKGESLSPEAYSARLTASTSVERLLSASRALAPLYRIGNGTGISTSNVQHRLMLVALPEELDLESGQAIARGLTGSRLVSMAGDATTTDALWWAVVAQHGARFRLASPEEHADALALMREACRTPALGETLSAGLVL